MQFTTLALYLSLALSATALPSPSPYAGEYDAPGNEVNTEVAGHGEGNPGTTNKGLDAGSSFSNKGKINELELNQAVEQCGNQQINCCNQVKQEGDQQDGLGVLGSVLSPDGGILALQCNPILLADILGGQCSPKNINCCKEEPHQMNSATGGTLLNLELKCVNLL